MTSSSRLLGPSSSPGGVLSRLFAVQDTAALVARTQGEGQGLRKSVSAIHLTALGVGGIIGTGIFVVIGEGVRVAGPAVVLSFVLAALACAFSALSYAELASSIPIAGSAYTYTYATLGELVAWIIGWDLILEYGISVAAVAVGWGGNLNAFLESAFGFEIPTAIATSPENGGIFNLPAVVLVLGISGLLVLGTRESARAALIMVGLKLTVLTFFIVVAFANFHPANFDNFASAGQDGVVSAAAIIFFAFIGFDAVSTGSEEARNPKRDLPMAIIGSLVICTVFYVLVSVGAIGVASSEQLSGSDAPLATALSDGAGINWAGAILAFGALVAITSVALVITFGQTRIFFAMCRDGLLPQSLSAIHPRFGTPARLTIALGVLISLLAAFVPLGEIVKLVNIGTLFAFVLVNTGVIILRWTKPRMPRAYKVPFAPVTPLIGIAFAIYLMADLPLLTWMRFGLWLAAGIVIYVFYGFHHSRLRSGRGSRETEPEDA
jgi:APA family basic amino acid/polyamine antiporter